MASRLRKTRRLRGGRHMGWGQVGQHRSFGHKGGLGRSGHLKHLWSTVIKEDQDHFGHESTHRPASVSAQEKIKQAGGEVTLPVQKTNKNIEVPLEEEKNEDVENNDG